jgi:hypothetical protein
MMAIIGRRPTLQRKCFICIMCMCFLVRVKILVCRISFVINNIIFDWFKSYCESPSWSFFFSVVDCKYKKLPNPLFVPIFICSNVCIYNTDIFDVIFILIILDANDKIICNKYIVSVQRVWRILVKWHLAVMWAYECWYTCERGWVSWYTYETHPRRTIHAHTHTNTRKPTLPRDISSPKYVTYAEPTQCRYGK